MKNRSGERKMFYELRALKRSMLLGDEGKANVIALKIYCIPGKLTAGTVDLAVLLLITLSHYLIITRGETRKYASRGVPHWKRYQSLRTIVNL
jgi:hypothetical protein